MDTYATLKEAMELLRELQESVGSLEGRLGSLEERTASLEEWRSDEGMNARVAAEEGIDMLIQLPVNDEEVEG